MGSIALTVLTLTLGAFFMFVGHFKVTDKFFPDVYEDMRREFGRVNNVFPLYKQTGWRPFAKNYRLAVGLAEFIGGAVLVFVPGRLKQVANVVLLAVMLGAVYTHYALNDKFERVAPGLVFSLLLLTRLIIHRQVTQREKRLSAQKKPVKVETPKKKVQEVEIEQESDDQESQSDDSEDNQETKADKKNDKKNK